MKDAGSQFFTLRVASMKIQNICEDLRIIWSLKYIRPVFKSAEIDDASIKCFAVFIGSHAIVLDV